MNQGHIYFAKHKQFYILKMQGKVRFIDCGGFQTFHNQLKTDVSWERLIIDLTEIVSIDSTALGLIASCAILSQKLQRERPIIFIATQEIERILLNMRFEQAFDMHYSPKKGELDVQEWFALGTESYSPSEFDMARQVLEAHQYLVEMNDQNRHLFQEVIQELSKDLETQSQKDKKK